MKRLGIWISGLFVIVILVYGLTVEDNQVRAQTYIPPAGGTNLNILTSAGGEVHGFEDADLAVTIYFDKTADLPEHPPDAWGVLLSQTPSSYMISAKAARVVKGERICQRTDQGQGTEILVKNNTRFIEDVTDFDQAKAGKQPNHLYLQQTLREVSQPTKMPDCASLQVWGKQEGDLVIAEMIFYRDEGN